MRGGLFVTGATGFVGRRLQPALQAAGRPVYCLVRRPAASQSAGGSGAVRLVEGDLLEPDRYTDALRSCDTVLHMAAATGRASAADHQRVNEHGTAALVEACRRAGVTRFVFVSSIATTFPDLAGYHYARAKKRAEALVAGSGLRYAIVRPTIILGPGAPILQSLEKLALLPIAVLPGSGRCRVQPIHVDDVIRFLLEIVRQDDLNGQTVDIGGPEVLTMDALIRRLRSARTGRGGPVLRVPLPVLQWPLRLAEAAGLGRFLPLTAGQLTSFKFDGTAASSRLTATVGDLQDVDSMIRAEAPASPAPDDAECRTLTRHVLGVDPDEYVIAKYRDAVATVPALSAASRFDNALLSFARRGPARARVADAYASLFAKESALRRRLVLLLAILETRPPFSDDIDRARDEPAAIAILRIAGQAAASIASLVAGIVVFGPARILLGSTRKGDR